MRIKLVFPLIIKATGVANKTDLQNVTINIIIEDEVAQNPNVKGLYYCFLLLL